MDSFEYIFGQINHFIQILNYNLPLTFSLIISITGIYAHLYAGLFVNLEARNLYLKFQTAVAGTGTREICTIVIVLSQSTRLKLPARFALLKIPMPQRVSLPISSLGPGPGLSLILSLSHV